MGWDLLYGNYIKDAMESLNTQSIKQKGRIAFNDRLGWLYEKN